MLHTFLTGEDYYSDSLPVTPLGPILKIILYGIYYCMFDYNTEPEHTSPQILIKCNPEEEERVTSVIPSACRNYNNSESDNPLLLSLAAEEIKNGIRILVLSDYVSISETEHIKGIDPVADPLCSVLKELKKQFPNIEINVALLYHINVGTHDGYDVLWLEGNEKQVAGLLLNNAIKQDIFWDEEAWRETGYEEGYEGILRYILFLIDFCDEEVLDVFMSHVPDSETELRNRLLEQIRIFKETGTINISNSLLCDFCDRECSEDEIIHKRSPDGTICTVCKECCIEYGLADWKDVEDN